jgi:hypothetical protein
VHSANVVMKAGFDLANPTRRGYREDKGKRYAPNGACRFETVQHVEFRL